MFHRSFLIGAVTVVGVMIVIFPVMFVALNSARDPNPDDIAAPIETIDAVGSETADVVPGETADAVNGETVVGYHDSVSYVVGPTWVDARDFTDLSAAIDSIPPAIELLGMHFTNDPNVAVAQFVTVVAGPPEYPGASLDTTFDTFLTGVADGGGGVVSGDRSHFTTSSGLDGVSSSLTSTIGDIDAVAHVSGLANGQTMVFVQWVSYQGPVDEQAYQAFLNSIRIDA